MNKTIRNIVIFWGITVGGGFLGHFLNTQYQPENSMESLGVLIWLVSPLAANLLLRALGGDGWKDFGLGLHLKASWRWYLAALVLVPLISLVLVGLGAGLGVTNTAGFASQGWEAFLVLLGTGFAGSAVKNIFEEFAWRGYLTPRLEQLRLPVFVRASITGVIWATWHIPYYLYFLSAVEFQKQTSASVLTIILFALVLLPFQALAYSELRLLSQSVWPVWLLHTLANAFSFGLVTGGFVILPRDFSAMLFSPGTEGVLYALLMGAIGWGLHQYRTRAEKAAQS